MNNKRLNEMTAEEFLKDMAKLNFNNFLKEATEEALEAAIEELLKEAKEIENEHLKEIKDEHVLEMLEHYLDPRLFKDVKAVGGTYYDEEKNCIGYDLVIKDVYDLTIKDVVSIHEFKHEAKKNMTEFETKTVILSHLIEVTTVLYGYFHLRTLTDYNLNEDIQRLIKIFFEE